MTREKVGLVKTMSPEHKLLVAWIAAPLLYDLIARDGGTFSEGIHRLRHRHPLLVDAAIDITAQHFKDRLPKQIDPFHQGLKVAKGGSKMNQRLGNMLRGFREEPRALIWAGKALVYWGIEEALFAKDRYKKLPAGLAPPASEESLATGGLAVVVHEARPALSVVPLVPAEVETDQRPLAA